MAFVNTVRILRSPSYRRLPTFAKCGLQAKAGDISGEVNSAIDEIMGQAKDAFAMPYYEIGSREPRYTSTFVVAISGKFTANAKEKIVHKLPPGLIAPFTFRS